MVNRQNQPAYHLVFGTHSPKGLEAMKRAMRSASQTGTFSYSDVINPAQPVLPGLDKANEYSQEIADLLLQKYEGQEVTKECLLKEVIDWDRWWLPRDLRDALIRLEYGDDPRIASVRNSDGRRRPKGKYPAGCFITFGTPLQSQLTLRL